MRICTSCGLTRACDNSQPFTFNSGGQGATGAPGANGTNGTTIVEFIYNDTPVSAGTGSTELETTDFDTTWFASVGDEVEIEIIATIASAVVGVMAITIDDGVAINFQLGSNYVVSNSTTKVVRFKISMIAISLTGADNIFTTFEVDETASTTFVASQKIAYFKTLDTLPIGSDITDGLKVASILTVGGDITIDKLVIKNNKVL